MKLTLLVCTLLVSQTVHAFDLGSLVGAIKGAGSMLDSKEMNYHDMMIAYMKEKKVPAATFVDTYMGTFQKDEFDKYKDDELVYDEKIKKSTEMLQNTMDKFEMKPYKIQHSFTFGKYDTAKECFNMGDSTLNAEGFVSTGNYFGLQYDPLIIDSPKSKTVLAPVLKLRPKNSEQFSCIKVPKDLASKITALGDSTSRNTEVRFDLEVVSIEMKKISYTRPKAPTKLQYLHKIDPGTEDVKAEGYIATVEVKTVRVFKPGYSDQILTIYNLP